MQFCRSLSFILLLVMFSGGRCTYDLTIMHTNDVHARFEQFNRFGADCSEDDEAEGACFGGVARRVTKIKEIRATYDNTLLLDGGDQFQGTQWFYFYQGRATSHFMNRLGYDAMAIGNHEFDLGNAKLIEFLRNVTFPVLSSNIDASSEPELEALFQKSVVLSVSGEMIGIVGYTFYKTPEISKPSSSLIFNEEIPSIQAEVNKLMNSGVNKIIALGHSGYDIDIEIAKKTVGIDIIVGGHSDTFLYSGTPPTDDVVIGPYPTIIIPENSPEDQVLVVQDFTFAKFLGFLQVTFDESGKIISHNGNPILLDETVDEDPDTLTEINKFSETFKNLSRTALGETYVLLVGEKVTCRTQECNLGDVVADAMLESLVSYQSEESWSDVSISILNGGGIRTTVGQGVITIADVTAVLPFQGTFDVFDLQGKYLLEALENSVYYYNDTSLWGRFLQVSEAEIKLITCGGGHFGSHLGLEWILVDLAKSLALASTRTLTRDLAKSRILVTYNLTKLPGYRVVSVEVRCAACPVPKYELLDLDKTYRIVAPSYIVGGGDGYTMVADNLRNHQTGNLDSSVLGDYIQKYSPILQGIERRIMFVEEKSNLATKNSISLFCIYMVTLAIYETFIY
ncbi:5'-nucleotidase [Holothuria leucospilota]|uniref:5'-nucleotidase n=1 Tax=Holothuria leucospilota TaxID=206669 RepID=A0A9Q1BEP7_HOLLE|nr:5'-nucleotidase [Holothuria leucospilota]